MKTYIRGLFKSIFIYFFLYFVNIFFNIVASFLRSANGKCIAAKKFSVAAVNARVAISMLNSSSQNTEGIFVMTMSLKVWQNKARVAPSSHGARLTLLNTNLVFFSLRDTDRLTRPDRQHKLKCQKMNCQKLNIINRNTKNEMAKNLNVRN